MDNNQRKAELKNLLIYLGITFAVSWAMFCLLFLSGNSLFDESGSMSGVGSLICTLGMLCPAAGAVITRCITKEGCSFSGENSLMLGIDLKNGKIIFYLIAVFLPWIYTELGNLLKIIIQPGCFDREFFNSAVSDIRDAYIFPLTAIVSGVFFSIGGLGEELGWYGYMMPRLIKLFGFIKSVIIGGIIWGIWHWPLTYAGYNFGRDYKGYPWAGFAGMVFLCVIMGSLLTFVTVKTGSVWPAAIMHAVTNTSPSILQFFINPEKVKGMMSNSAVSFVIHFIPLLIISVFICIAETAK